MVGSSPPQVVITRWGTFIATAKFYALTYKKVQDWIDTLKSGAGCVAALKELRGEINLDYQLMAIERCAFILEYIEKFQAHGLSVTEMRKMLEEVKEKLPKFARDKLQKSIDKNVGLKKFIDNLDKPNNYDLRRSHQYAPLVSVDVERSFSLYKYILSDRRTNLTEENIERLNIIMYNRQADDPGQIPVFDL